MEEFFQVVLEGRACQQQLVLDVIVAQEPKELQHNMQRVKGTAVEVTGKVHFD